MALIRAIAYTKEKGFEQHGLVSPGPRDFNAETVPETKGHL